MIKILGVIGGAESGVGAALLAKENGWEVFVSDFGMIAEDYKKELEENEIAFEEGGHTEERLLKADMIVKSPGVPEKAPIIKMIREKDIPIISEIDFASRYYSGQIIAVTGSNGKTTTASLIHHILITAGLKAILAGNIGTSFSRAIINTEINLAVIEVSSFQLDDLLIFQPKVAVITNVTPDHLDRYDYSFDKYAEAKFKITEYQKAGDILIYNASDKKSMDLVKHVSPEIKKLSVALADLDEILAKPNGKLCTLNLLGTHNRFNAAMAVFAARAIEVSKENIIKGVESFDAIEHRLEMVDVIDGVTYINDSKATNVDSAYFALEGIYADVLWIVGGVDKGNDYTSVNDLVKEKVKEIIVLSKHPEKIQEAFGSFNIPISQFQNTKDAVEYAKNHSENGDFVLLSPACASFDLFDDYEQRGNIFKEEVLKLRN